MKPKKLGNLRNFRIFLVFFGRYKRKNRREVLVLIMTTFLCENSICFSFLSFHFYPCNISVTVFKQKTSVDGAPWSCGVLTTQGGIPEVGLGHVPKKRA